MGWDDETIRQSIDRLHRLKINRLRVLVYGRNEPRPWRQPVVPTENFQLHLNPWVAERPDDIKNPGFDLKRFNVDHWRKYERLLRYAREKDVIISVIFFIGGQVLPTPFEADSEEERLYYRYAVARLAAFSNVTWDLGNEYNFHRKAPDWADRMGHLVKQWDPYDHLTSAHNVVHRTPKSTWLDMQLIQRWDSGQTDYMLGHRAAQEKTGYIIPQVNEEYGYEDLWEKYPGHRAAETRRKDAWEISMAGCYQTTGESARRGTGVAPDTGGGWVNGRGDDTMTMLARLRPHRRFLHRLRLVELPTAQRRGRGGGLLPRQAGTALHPLLPRGRPGQRPADRASVSRQVVQPANRAMGRRLPGLGTRLDHAADARQRRLGPLARAGR